jgi:hypothetical protein
MGKNVEDQQECFKKADLTNFVFGKRVKGPTINPNIEGGFPIRIMFFTIHA